MPRTTYAAVMGRVLGLALGLILYSQSAINRWTKVRSDCSGLVWYYWTGIVGSGAGMWLGAPSTESMWRLGIIRQIAFSELEPGDGIGYCGPDTANDGGGHIALWIGGDRFENGNYHVRDHGSGWGPKDRWVKWNGTSTGWLHPSKLKAWRYVNIEESDDMFAAFGEESPRVWVLQSDLNELLAAQGQPLISVDSEYGGETASAVVRSGIVGGDKTGRTYGAGEYRSLQAALRQLAAKREATSPDLSALVARVAKLEAALVGLAKTVSDAVAAAVAKLRITLGG